MTETMEIRGLLAARLSVLRDACVAQIEKQRAVSSMPEALIGISEAVPSVASQIDDLPAVALLAEDNRSSLNALGVKRAAREIASVKIRSTSANAGGKNADGTFTRRSRAGIDKDAVHTWGTGTDTAKFESDVKKAILAALGQA